VVGVPDVTEITNDDWQQNTLAMTMCGGSGAGKTTTARCLHHDFDGVSILLDLDHEPDFGVVVDSVAGLRDALARGERRVAVRPPADVVTEPEVFPEVVRFLIDVGNELREAGKGKMQFLMDEAQDLQTEMVEVALKRLRKRRIKPVAMTQDPISLSKRCRTVADYNCWLSPPDADMKRNLKQSTGYPTDLLVKLEPYQMLVLGDGWEPEARFKAGAEYAE
jgi:hypothetical protein